MRTLGVIMMLILMMGCGRHSSVSDAVESAILWDAKVDAGWTPIAMAEAVQDTDMFEPEGNFYKVKGNLKVFGHPATYVGILGVELIPGPNAVVKGTSKSVSDYITKHRGLSFLHEGDTYACQYKTDITIIVTPHPNLPDSVMIIGGYFGK